MQTRDATEWKTLPCKHKGTHLAAQGQASSRLTVVRKSRQEKRTKENAKQKKRLQGTDAPTEIISKPPPPPRCTIGFVVAGAPLRRPARKTSHPCA